MATRQPRYIANFDSSGTMLVALANFLDGRDFPRVGSLPAALEPFAAAMNHMPRRIRELTYSWSGWAEAVSASRMRKVRAEKVAEWMVSRYPRRQYPAIAVGSSGGASTHLCAALGIPWLPQTFMIPVRRSGIHEDETLDDLRWASKPAAALLDANPDLELHHLNDPCQDRLMIRRIAYFRVKWLSLPEPFRQFIQECLAPGGTLLLLECNLKWPSVQLGERHYFQHGGIGGATPQEFVNGSDRVASYLQRYGSHRRKWPSPAPDGWYPEAEWGYAPQIRKDVDAISHQQGYKIRRVLYDEPEHLSPLVAGLYSWWYRQRGYTSRRLMVSSFMLMEPYWALRTGSTPYWMTFNKQPSADALQEYLDYADPFEEIYMMVFNHGVESVGLVPIEKWREILARAQHRSGFLGLDEKAYPLDVAGYFRYHRDAEKIPARCPMPDPLTFDQLDQFLAEYAHVHRVQWHDGDSRTFGPVDGRSEAFRSSAIEYASGSSA